MEESHHVSELVPERRERHSVAESKNGGAIEQDRTRRVGTERLESGVVPLLRICVGPTVCVDLVRDHPEICFRSASTIGSSDLTRTFHGYVRILLRRVVLDDVYEVR